MYIAIITNSDESKQNCVVMNIRSNLRMLYANLRRLKIDIRLCSTAFVTTLTQPACHSLLNSTEKRNEHGMQGYYVRHIMHNE